MANLFSIPSQHMANWGDALISKNPPWRTTPEYHQWASKDLTQQKSKEIAQDHGNLAAGAFELAAPIMALGASPIYDIAQAIHRYKENPDEYSGIWNAIDQEDVLSAAWNRFIGAGKPLYTRLMNKPQNLYDVENRKNLRILNMNRRKQIMQQNIKQAEAIEAAKKAAIRPTNVPGTPIVPTGGGGGGGGGGYQPTTRAQNVARTESRVGPGGNVKAYGLASGGIANLYRYGGFSG